MLARVTKLLILSNNDDYGEISRQTCHDYAAMALINRSSVIGLGMLSLFWRRSSKPISIYRA